MVKYSLYDEMVDISQEYLGPAAERFIRRQISTHLQKSPSELTLPDVPVLINWIRMAFVLLTDDTDQINGYIQKLEELMDKPKRRVDA